MANKPDLSFGSAMDVPNNPKASPLCVSYSQWWWYIGTENIISLAVFQCKLIIWWYRMRFPFPNSLLPAKFYYCSFQGLASPIMFLSPDAWGCSGSYRLISTSYNLGFVHHGIT